jgi:hypothetical protein
MCDWSGVRVDSGGNYVEEKSISSNLKGYEPKVDCFW